MLKDSGSFHLTNQGLEDLESLEILVLDGNKISEIKGLDKLKNLEYLRLGGNKITEIKGLEKTQNLHSAKRLNPHHTTY